MTAQKIRVQNQETEMEFELVVFDMSGTTVYDGDAVHRCLHDALRTAGVRTSRAEINLVMGIAKPLAIRTLLQSKLADPAQVTDELVNTTHLQFVTRMMAYYHTAPAVREVDGAADTIRALRAVGIKTALDTGFSRAIADSILDRLGWSRPPLLDATVTSDEVAHGRPFPDMIYRAMELTGVTDVKRVVKVGDTPSDLQQGTAAGCGMVVGVTRGSHTREELEAQPHTHLIGTVAELPALLLGVPA
jgi:phosphonatase-like hydrolase